MNSMDVDSRNKPPSGSLSYDLPPLVPVVQQSWVCCKLVLMEDQQYSCTFKGRVPHTRVNHSVWRKDDERLSP